MIPVRRGEFKLRIRDRTVPGLQDTSSEDANDLRCKSGVSANAATYKEVQHQHFAQRHVALSPGPLT